MGNADNPTGAKFEAAVQAFFRSKGLDLHRDYSVDVGAGSTHKSRKFDLGSGKPATLVECKSHTWTEGGNAPSAKLSVWNEAMLYFLVAPPSHRKILAVLGLLGGQEVQKTVKFGCDRFLMGRRLFHGNRTRRYEVARYH